MPGFTTHYLFGVDTYKRMRNKGIRKLLYSYPNAYALGLQGPDIFFYYPPSHLKHEMNIGDLAHKYKTNEFYARLIETHDFFKEGSREQRIVDAYITGFLGHYTLDSIAHPYVYAFTKYDPNHAPTVFEYFGSHAYFETELDNDLLYLKKHVKPHHFSQSATIHLSRLERKVIAKILCYAYNKTYPDYKIGEREIRMATLAMYLGTTLLRDPKGKKKVIVRYVEKLTLKRALISPMIASSRFRFVKDPMNLSHKKWIHPWTGKSSDESFLELYDKASGIFIRRIDKLYAIYEDEGEQALIDFLREHGNKSFLSGIDSLSD